MSNYTNTNRRSDKTSSGKRPFFKANDKKRSGALPGISSRNGGGGKPKFPVKKFNPSMFIKKVEEQAAPSAAYIPKHAFSDFAITDLIKENIAYKGYTSPTPIQDQAIPLLLEGRDVIGTANTGTGKTAAFLIPLVHNLLVKKIHRVLIIAPTRELAAQIQGELVYFKHKTSLNTVLCIGGVNIAPQIHLLRRDPAFVIGTPGRLKDLEEQKALSFGKFDAIVLDEVDMMLDMGFIKDIKMIISKLPQKRHSLFFSATISPEIKKVMDSFLQNPVSISVKTRQSAENVNQDVISIAGKKKIEVLHDLLIKPGFTKVIIFSRTKRDTEKLTRELMSRGFEVASIHGDKAQAQRKRALLAFKEDKVKILLATDVVARGIDVDDVSHVINYDMPQTHEDYIHRIGRTGRANKIGQALTFVD
jgi:ATP-dependent RNA helicase RhlE